MRPRKPYCTVNGEFPMAQWCVRVLMVVAILYGANGSVYGGFLTYAAVSYMDNDGFGQSQTDGGLGQTSASALGFGSYGGGSSFSMASLTLGPNGSIKL